MRFKKRYIPIIVAAGLFGLSRLPIFSMRQSNKKQTEYIEQATGITPNFGTYEIADRNIHFTQLSDDCEAKSVAILVHGSPGSSSAFLSYLVDAQLREFAQIIAVDRPGFGYSDYGDTEVSLQKQAAALYPILKMHQYQKVILVGHSFGGPLIVRMAMDYPDLVDGLVMVAGAVSPDLEPREWWRPVVNSPLIRWLLPPSMKVSNQEILPLWKELELMLPLWKKVTCPVTIIHGENDNLVPPGNADFAKKMLTNSQKVEMVMIPEGNHFILWSLQNLVVEKMVKMIKNFQVDTSNCSDV